MLRLLAAAIFLSSYMVSGVVHAGEFDGTWTGKWGGQASARILVANDKVVSYHFKGSPQTVGPTSVSGKTLTFGAKYRVTITLTGKNTANATYNGFGNRSSAKLTRN